MFEFVHLKYHTILIEEMILNIKLGKAVHFSIMLLILNLPSGTKYKIYNMTNCCQFVFVFCIRILPHDITMSLSGN